MALPGEDDDEAREVWNELRSTRDPASREDLLVRLAECALDSHDFTNLDVPEDIHDALSEMRASQERYQLTAIRVGRLVAQLIEMDQESVPVANEGTTN